eukprot:gene3549-6161_t
MRFIAFNTELRKHTKPKQLNNARTKDTQELCWVCCAVERKRAPSPPASVLQVKNTTIVWAKARHNRFDLCIF